MLEEFLNESFKKLSEMGYTCSHCGSKEDFYVSPVFFMKKLGTVDGFMFKILCKKCCHEILTLPDCKTKPFDSIPRINITSDEESGDYGKL